LTSAFVALPASRAWIETGLPSGNPNAEAFRALPPEADAGGGPFNLKNLFGGGHLSVSVRWLTVIWRLKRRCIIVNQNKAVMYPMRDHEIVNGFRILRKMRQSAILRIMIAYVG
jgi:hypothetical protein